MHRLLKFKFVTSSEFTYVDKGSEVNNFVKTQREQGYPVEHLENLNLLFSYAGSLNHFSCPKAVVGLNSAYITSLHMGLPFGASTTIFKHPPFSRHKTSSPFIQQGDYWTIPGERGFSFSQEQVLSHLEQRELDFEWAVNRYSQLKKLEKSDVITMRDHLYLLCDSLPMLS